MAETRNESEAPQEEETQYPYVVRGATIYCTCGSHTRKLDMPVSHGSYIRDKAMLNNEDCKVGIDQNIPPFGACFSSDKDGIEGKLCEPKITTKWQGAQEDTLVDGKPALKADCCITCCYGGTIGFMDSGQEVY